ncbi:MAG: tRNA pseudouridine38-40 synthase [Limisphaerales bacterium]
MDVRRLKLTIAYDGSNYAGFQWQPNDIGVQQRLEEALQKLYPSVKRIHGSSRTDTGVHARGMVAHVDVPHTRKEMTPSKLRLALNANLPEDVRISLIQRVASDFHARFDAKGKQYRYFIWNHAAMDPLRRTQTWHMPRKLDLEAMRDASQRFVGKHDFESFANCRSYKVENYVRTLTRCDVQRRGPLLTVVIEGGGFLYKMCRGIVGTLIYVGEGKLKPAEINKILKQRDRRVAGMTAPAHGLVLWKVFY